MKYQHHREFVVAPYLRTVANLDGEIPTLPFPVVHFKLTPFRTACSPDAGEAIYECQEPGCPGCGCPPFPLDQPLPKDVEELLEVHAKLYHSEEVPCFAPSAATR